MVEELVAQGHQSQHLDRLRERLPQIRGTGMQGLYMEILQEMASSLGRASEKVDHALLKLEVIGRKIDEATEPTAKTKLIAEFNAQREVALHALWELKVHREAIGMRQHDQLAKMYPVPPKRG